MEIFLPTYVEFESHSSLLALLSLCTLLPVFAYSSLLTLLVSLRSLRAASALAGLAFSHVSNSALKRLLAHPRPAPHPHALHPLDSHGMPSNHAQQAAFLGAYAAAQLLRAHPRRGEVPAGERAVGVAGCVAYVAATACSRVLVRAHSLDQVAAGAAIGLATALGWVAAERFCLELPVVRRALGSRLVRDVLRLRVATARGVERNGGTTSFARATPAREKVN
jgi:membrane-associated phospholipid phosphatase